MSTCSITLENKDKLPKIINKLEFFVFRALEKRGMDFFDLTGKDRTENLKKLLDTVKTDIIPGYINDYDSQAASHKNLGNNEAAEEFEIYTTNLRYLLSHWEKILPNFIYYSSVFSVKSKFTLDAEGLVDMTDVADDEEKMYKMMVFDQAANEIDAMEQVDKAVELYLRSLTMPEEVDDYGFTVGINYAGFVQNMFHELQNTTSLEEIISKLEKNTANVPQYQEIVDKLKFGTQHSGKDLMFKIAFRKSFMKAFIPIYMVSVENLTDEGVKIKVLEAANGKRSFYEQVVSSNFMMQGMPVNYKGKTYNLAVQEEGTWLLNATSIPKLLGYIDEKGITDQELVDRQIEVLKGIGFQFTPESINALKLSGFLGAGRRIKFRYIFNQLLELLNYKSFLTNPYKELKQTHVYGPLKYTEKGESQNNALLDIIQIELKNNKLYNVQNTVINADGNTQNTVQDHNNFTMVNKMLSDPEAFPTLQSILDKEPTAFWMNPETNVSIRHSMIMNSLFFMDLSDPNYGKRKRVIKEGKHLRFSADKGEFVQVQLNNTGGVQSRKMVGGITESDSSTTVGLSDIEKILQDMNSFGSKGYNSILRLSDKSTDLGISLNYYQDPKTGQPVKRPLQNQEESATTIFSNTAFQNYINGALVDILALKWLHGKGFLTDTKMANKALVNSFSYLDKVLSSSTKSQLSDVINQAKKIEDLEVLMEPLLADIQKDTISYFENTAQQFINYMKPTLRLASSKDLIGNPNFDQAAKFYVANSFIMDLEQLKIFFGDSIFHKDFHKRAAKDSATGTFPIAEDMILNELNNREDQTGMGWNTNLGIRMLLQRLLATKQISQEQYRQRMMDLDVTKSFNSAVLEDVVLNSTQIGKIQKNIQKLKNESFIVGKLADLYDNSLSKVISEKYLDAKEADGQGKCTFDFYRIISIMTSQWSPEQEIEYNKIITYDYFDRMADSTTNEQLKSQYIQQRNAVGYDPTNAVYFPPKKFQYAGPQKYERNIQGQEYSMMVPIFDKFSLQPLIPTMTKGKPDDHLLQRMMISNTGYVKYASGTKSEQPGKLDTLYENYDAFDPGNRTVKPFSPLDTFVSKQELFFSNLKEQLLIDAEIHDHTIFGSQIRKLIMMNIDRPEMEVLYKNYKQLLSDTVELEKTAVFQDLGIERDGNKLKVKDLEKLVNYFLKEIDKKGQDNNVRKALKYDAATGKFEIPLDAAVQAQVLEGIVIGAINNRVVRYKTNGSMLTQVATTGNEPIRYNKDSSDLALRTYGSEDLKYYDVIEKDGKTVVSAMEVKIGLTGQWLKLLELSHYDGFKIGSLERLNDALKNEEWKNKNRQAITMVAYRIPTQGRNFSDVMEIKEFLPAHFGDAIIMPSEVVIKSGSDFDIDKMFVFYPNLDKKGNYINYEYGKDMLYQDLEKLKDDSVFELKHLKLYRTMTLTRLQDEFYEARNKFLKARGNDTRTRARLNDLMRQVKVGLALLEAEDKNIKSAMKSLTLKNEREDGRLDQMITDSIIFNLDEYTAYKKLNGIDVLNPSNWIDSKRRGLEYLMTAMGELRNQTLDDARNTLAFTEEAAGDFKDEINAEIESVERKLYKARNIKANIQNKLYQNMADVILHPSNYLELITPSDNFLLMPIIDDLYKRLGKGVDKDGVHIKTDYNHTDILNRTINAQKFLSLLKSKSDLGIAAVANTFNVLFQRSGARANGDFFRPQGKVNIETFFTGTNITKEELTPRSIDYSSVYDDDGNLKSEFYSEFINAFVDAAKDDYVFAVNVVTELSPLMFYMKYMGLSTDKIMYFVNQPAIRRYVKNMMKYDNKFVKTASGTEIKARQAALVTTLEELGVNLKKVNRGTIREYLKEIGINKNAAEAIFEAESLKNGVKPDDEFSTLTLKERNRQVAMLMEMLNLKEQSSSLTELQKAMNFDTKPYASSFDVYAREQVYKDGMSGKHILSPSSIDSIRKDSIIAPLNVENEIKFLLQELFPVRNDLKFNEELLAESKALRENFENKGMNTTDDQMKFARTAKNDLANYVLQNHLQNSKEAVQFFQENFKTDKSLNEYLLELVNTTKMRDGLKSIRALVDYDKLVEVYPIVHNLVMEPGDNNQKLTNFRVIQSSNNSIDKNAVIYQFEQIVNMDVAGDADLEMIRDFFKDLALYSVFQSGMNTSDISYTNLTPIDLINKLYGFGIDEFNKLTPEQKQSEYKQFMGLFKKNNPVFYGGKAQVSIIKDVSKRGKWYSKETQLLFAKKKEETAQSSSGVVNARTIYAKLGNKTQSTNVILPGDLEDNKVYSGKNFWNDIVPEAKDMFDDKVPGKKPMLIAYRGNSKKSFLENYKYGNTVGNPFDWQVETGTREEKGIKSTKRFIHWMITGDNMGTVEATESYRQAIIADIKSGRITNSPILYYQEKNYATHATALDYLINQHNWNSESNQPEIKSVDKPAQDGVKVISQDDISAFQNYLKKSNGVLPKEFFTATTTFKVFYNPKTGRREKAPQSSKWFLNNKNTYDLIDKDGGEIYITNVDLITGIQKIQPIITTEAVANDMVSQIEKMMAETPGNWEMSAGQIADLYKKEQMSNESLEEFFKRMSCLGKIK